MSFSGERSPGAKVGLLILVGMLLSLPLFAVWMLVYDRQQQSEFARSGIVEGWAGPQTMSGPLLVIPYRVTVEEQVAEGERLVTRTRAQWRRMTLAPEVADLATEVRPERRRRSIYEAVVYEADMSGRARFALPQDLARLGIDPAALDLARAELRFGLSDPRGLGANPRVSAGGEALRLQPGGGAGQPGFFAWLDAGALRERALDVDFAFSFRGNGSLALAPRAGDTRWALRSPWPHPSFQGGFLPAERRIGDEGFEALYRIGNLALGHGLVLDGEAGAPPQPDGRTSQTAPYDRGVEVAPPPPAAGQWSGASAQVGLMQPVDLYSRVNRSAKYGFLFIGFTFLAFLLFEVIGGARVSAVEYLLVGAGLVLFFVLLLALAEVTGFAIAYVLAAAAITGLNTAYSAAVLGSWRRAGLIGALLIGLYAALYVLLSLEAYSLLIGALLLFAALATVMYATRGIDWGRHRSEEPPAPQPAA